MSTIHYIMTAGMLISLSLGFYLFILGRRQNELMARLNKLEALGENADD